MKKIVIIFLAFLSCNKGKQDQLKLRNSELNNFINTFNEIHIDDLKVVNFNRVQNNGKIDSSYVGKFLCFEKNSCFYSRSSLKNSYYRLFRFKYSDNVELLFYRVNEPPVDGKIVIAAVNKLEERVNSKLIISNFNPRDDYVHYEVKIRNNLEFEITRLFKINNYYIEPTDNNVNHDLVKKVTETYICDNSGVFNLKG